MNKKQLDKVLAKHKLWLDGKPDGERADLSGADLSGANLSGAVLTGANLTGAVLTGANLYGAVLRYANLTGAVLRSADLRSANLTGANLRSADLRSADLRSADLTGANLSYAKLTDASGSHFVIFQFGKHCAVFAGGYGSIGCERHTYQEWLDNYQTIGKDNGYTDDECIRYGKLIAMAVEYLLEVESVSHAS